LLLFPRAYQCSNLAAEFTPQNWLNQGENLHTRS
jgi:hypothetical protein